MRAFILVLLLVIHVVNGLLTPSTRWNALHRPGILQSKYASKSYNSDISSRLNQDIAVANHLRGNQALYMGLGDMFKKAFENENLPPPKNPGLSKELTPVVIEFLPSKKTVKALPGQKISVVAQSSGVDIKYSCKKGDCGTCSVKVNGSMARACQTAIPNVQSKVTIEVLPPRGVKK